MAHRQILLFRTLATCSLSNTSANLAGKYRHYKGNHYEVIGSALHTETKEKLVVYRALYELPDLLEEYGPDPLFVRPYKMFFEDVEVDGKMVHRFQKEI